MYDNRQGDVHSYVDFSLCTVWFKLTKTQVVSTSINFVLSNPSDCDAHM
jgi:hypothetical protein